MALIEIEYGAIASSSIMNGNFQYLDNRISTVVQNSAASSASINSAIASINSSITSLSSSTASSVESLQSSIDSITSKLSSNGLYIDTYVNGTSWFREYFSDAEKTTRVWIEQGGIATTQNTTTLLKEMSNANYTLVLGRRAAYIEAEAQEGTRTSTSFYLKNGRGYVYSVDYYICGI